MSIGRVALRKQQTVKRPAQPGERVEARRSGFPLRYEVIVAGGCLLMLGSSHLVGTTPLIWRGVLTVAVTAGGILCSIAAGASVAVGAVWSRYLAQFRYIALIGAAALAAYSLTWFVRDAPVIFAAAPSTSYETDVMAFTYTNAQLVLSGQNPYTSDAVFPTALQRYPRVIPTAMRRGAFGADTTLPDQTRLVAMKRQYLASPETAHGEFDPRTLHSYPALSFLLYLPLVWAGVKNIVMLNVIVYFGLMTWLVQLAPVGWRRWAILTAATVAMIPARSLLGDTEVICVSFLLAAWHNRQHRWREAVLLGMACAFKQYCWFFVPFYALDVIAEHGWREAGRRGAIALGAFLLPNLPFLLASPGAWFSSLWLPMTDPMFPLGMGLVALSVNHVISSTPAFLYTALEGIAMVGAIWIAGRWRIRLGDSVLLLALVPLFFAYRSLPNYFAFAPWLALYAANQFYARAQVFKLSLPAVALHASEPATVFQG